MTSHCDVTRHLRGSKLLAELMAYWHLLLSATHAPRCTGSSLQVLQVYSNTAGEADGATVVGARVGAFVSGHAELVHHPVLAGVFAQAAYPHCAWQSLPSGQSLRFARLQAWFPSQLSSAMCPVTAPNHLHAPCPLQNMLHSLPSGQLGRLPAAPA